MSRITKEQIKLAKFSGVRTIMNEKLDRKEKLMFIDSVIDENRLFSNFLNQEIDKMGISWFGFGDPEDKIVRENAEKRFNKIIKKRNELLDEEQLNKINPWCYVNRCVGTEPYLSSHLEMDIKDVFAMVICRYDDLESCDDVMEIDTSKEAIEELADNEGEHYSPEDIFL